MNDEYFDYTAVKRHRTRIWRMSDSINLAKWGGLDLFAVGAAFGVAIVPTLLVAILVMLLRFPVMVICSLFYVGFGCWLYSKLTQENVKDTPFTIVKKWFMRRFQPRKYMQAIGADFAPDDLQWQVILWRPQWAPVRIGDIRRWESYDPAPIGEVLREDLDVTGAGELVDWNRHFYFDEEPDFDDEPELVDEQPAHTGRDRS